MGHRLSKIYTRTGDDGSTGLGDGSRAGKDGPRIEAIGTVDELNSHIGLLLSMDPGARVADFLLRVQHRLFDLGAELSIPDSAMLAQKQVDATEAVLDELNASLPPLKEFILPGGGRSGAQAHVCRVVCRRAERRLIALARTEQVNPVSIRYLNRLSDLFFVLARVLARQSGVDETLWRADLGEG